MAKCCVCGFGGVHSDAFMLSKFENICKKFDFWISTSPSLGSEVEVCSTRSLINSKKIENLKIRKTLKIFLCQHREGRWMPRGSDWPLENQMRTVSARCSKESSKKKRRQPQNLQERSNRRKSTGQSTRGATSEYTKRSYKRSLKRSYKTETSKETTKETTKEARRKGAKMQRIS